MNKVSKSFNIRNRAQQIEDAIPQEFDLIIIGGGITGAGILLDASTRGFNCLLIEKQDFASGTSGKSTKLIHGGLRYLKQLEFGLVRETGTERAVVHKLAPHLVHPEKMLLPIVKGGTFGKLSASMAISVYELLAKVEKEDKRKSLNKSQTKSYEPLLRTDILKGGIAYSEYRTDDARLTLENIKTAYRFGATIFNYCEVQSLDYRDGQICGVHVVDHVLDKEFTFKSKHVVSATGPWVDVIREKDNSLKGKKLRLTKGVHLVFDRKRLPLKQSIYFDAFDGRMLFAIPRGRVTYVGTSDTDYKDNMDRVICTLSDVDYILNATNNMLEVDNLKRTDVVSTWAGLRPLIQEEGKSPSELSRKDEIFESDSGFVSIAGGKLTGYRKMAQRIVDLFQERNADLPQMSCSTKDIPLAAEPLESYEKVESYIKELTGALKEYGDAPYYAWYLVSNYGRSSDLILNELDEHIKNGHSFDHALLKAEINFCIEYESVFLPDDFFNRRTGMLYFDPLRLKSNLDFILSCFAEQFDWDEHKLQEMHEYSQRLINDAAVIE